MNAFHEIAIWLVLHGANFHQAELTDIYYTIDEPKHGTDPAAAEAEECLLMLTDSNKRSFALAVYSHVCMITEIAENI